MMKSEELDITLKLRSKQINEKSEESEKRIETYAFPVTTDEEFSAHVFDFDDFYEKTEKPFSSCCSRLDATYVSDCPVLS